MSPTGQSPPAPPPTPDVTRAPTAPLEGYQVRVNDEANFRILRKDIFERRIYHFDSARPDPRILDAGGNIGLAVLYFKHVYPRARVVTFEPDPGILPFLHENIRYNGLDEVEVVPAALAARAGTRTMVLDGRYASALTTYRPSDEPDAELPIRGVPCVRLRDYLSERVDFLKMNIEGAETEVLLDSADRLGVVRRMVIEYHHLPGLPRTLHEILAMLDRRGFDYLINAFDDRTNPAARPPFRLGPRTRYYVLIYAQRRNES